MKKNILSLIVILSLFSFVFTQCSHKQKETEKKQQDSIALQNKITDSLKKIEEKVPAILVIQGTNVNLRVSPNTDAIRIRQFTTGDTCFILERGKKDTINDEIDYWYKVERKSKQGWIYGAFTSIKHTPNNKK